MPSFTHYIPLAFVLAAGRKTETKISVEEKMDPLPPDDPNNNQNNRIGREKEAPHDGSARQRDGGEMDVIGDLREQPIVVAMFLMGVASWFLRSQCTC